MSCLCAHIDTVGCLVCVHTLTQMDVLSVCTVSSHMFWCDLQAHAPRSHVIIVGTHLDYLDDIGRQKIGDLHTLIYTEYSTCHGYPRIKAIQEVSCRPGTLEGIQTLRDTVYLVATAIEVRLLSSAGLLKEKLVGRKVRSAGW